MAAPTTLPGSPTDGAAERAAALAIRWVFPSEAAPPVPFAPGSSRPLRLGRGDTCEHVLPGAEVSREHAELVMEGPLPVLRDKQSRNGVFVDGERVTQAMLKRGQVVRVGEWVGLVEAFDALEPPGATVLREVATGFHVGPALRGVVESARRAASSDLPIVVEGETGTGKERVARAIHEWGGARGPFVAVNCAALPEGLAEAELFGYRKGSFTGASGGSTGLFRAADGGTMLLDEVVDLPLAMQAKLLRVLEQREVVPIGETRPIPIQVRIVAAAQQPLLAAVREGKFRGDLLARLDGLTVRLPPLRERRLEAVPLFRRFVADRTGNAPPTLDPRFVERLCLHDWPFNVREVDLLARRLLVLHGMEPVLRRAHLPERMQPATATERTPLPSPTPTPTEQAPQSSEAREEHDLALLTHALRANGGNVARAAAQAGISRQRAYRLMAASPEGDWVAVRRPPR
jgi:transcriptional regulator of acetoin/glycerol metabolism